jgi:hypothetical protein
VRRQTDKASGGSHSRLFEAGECAEFAERLMCRVSFDRRAERSAREIPPRDCSRRRGWIARQKTVSESDERAACESAKILSTQAADRTGTIICVELTS